MYGKDLADNLKIIVFSAYCEAQAINNQCLYLAGAI